MKIVGLVPCLMQDNNREMNKKCLSFALNNYQLDDICVFDQCFKESDYQDNIRYIANKTEKMGFIVPRNSLLEWFYNSDYDYAIWFDANEYCSNTCLNELINIVQALKSGRLDIDCICSTMGIQASLDRSNAKQQDDYFEKITLKPLPFTKGTVSGYYTMHGMIIKNFKKYYNVEPYIDDRCDPWKGTSEDTYFGMLLRNSFDCHLAPTLVFSKGSANTSTWMNNQNGKYAYPPVDTNTLIKYVYQKNLGDYHRNIGYTIKLDRTDKQYIENLKEFKKRIKKDKNNINIIKQDLF